jgi:SWIM zinc finger
MTAPTIIVAGTGRESARVKAARLLVESRVRLPLVKAGRAWAVVNGDHGVYETGCSQSRWFCSCEHVGPRCSHILAVQAVTDLSTRHNDQEAQR